MTPTTLSCRCGVSTMQMQGDPIFGVECHCTSCRQAAERIARLPGGEGERSAAGGVPYGLVRKDRIAAGAGRFAEFRLRPDSPTRRVVATCCNSLMFLDFSKGHWLSVHAARWPEGARPAPEVRTMCRDRTDPAPLPQDVPNLASHNGRFMLRLLGAWARMGFRTPAVLPDLPALKEPAHA